MAFDRAMQFLGVDLSYATAGPGEEYEWKAPQFPGTGIYWLHR